MPCNHIMLDLETLSLRKDCAIIQIAAVAFDPDTGEIESSFSEHVLPETGHVDPGTCMWWMAQKHAPSIAASVLGASAVYVGGERGALARLAQWLERWTFGGNLAALWSHGATADIVWLENLYERHGMRKPWSYKIERDTRTLYALAPGGTPDVPLDEQREHDALYDCERQVAQVCGALRALREQAKHAALWTAPCFAEAPHADVIPEPFALVSEPAAPAPRVSPVLDFSAIEARIEAAANPSPLDGAPDSAEF